MSDEAALPDASHRIAPRPMAIQIASVRGVTACAICGQRAWGEVRFDCTSNSASQCSVSCIVVVVRARGGSADRTVRVHSPADRCHDGVQIDDRDLVRGHNLLRDRVHLLDNVVAERALGHERSRRDIKELCAGGDQPFGDVRELGAVELLTVGRVPAEKYASALSSS